LEPRPADQIPDHAFDQKTGKSRKDKEVQHLVDLWMINQATRIDSKRPMEKFLIRGGRSEATRQQEEQRFAGLSGHENQVFF